MMAIQTSMVWDLIVVLIYISLIISDAEHVFMCFLDHLYVICREMSIWYVAHFETELFFSLLLSFRGNLCILPTNLLSDMFATLSFHLLPFLLLIVSFAMQKLFSWM